MKVLIDEQKIENRVAELSAQIAADYNDKNLVVIGILKGAVLFMADLIKKIDIPLSIDFMAVSSYGKSTRSSGIVRILKDLDEEIEGKDVLIVEDIVDTGLTLKFLAENILSRNPKSLRVCCLLDKPSKRKVAVSVDYVGFEIPDEFVVGYGLDYDQKHRNMPFIGVIDEK